MKNTIPADFPRMSAPGAVGGFQPKVLLEKKVINIICIRAMRAWRSALIFVAISLITLSCTANANRPTILSGVGSSTSPELSVVCVKKSVAASGTSASSNCGG